MLAEDVSSDDRRRVVGAGIRHGRDAEIDDARAVADVGIDEHHDRPSSRSAASASPSCRVRLSERDQRPEAFHIEALRHRRDRRRRPDRGTRRASTSTTSTPPSTELDARYLAGEAAAHARTWSVITRVYTALNRHEISAATPDWVTVDHRPVQRIGAEDVRAYLRATWDVTPDIKFRIEEVHRLSSLGVVVTRVATGTSQEGFDAEWRQIDILTVDGDVLSRVEVFDEADIDAALARFDELSRPAPTAGKRREPEPGRNSADAFNATATGPLWPRLTGPDGHLDDRRTWRVRGFRHGSMRQRVVADAVRISAELATGDRACRAGRGSGLGLSRSDSARHR